jgi:hypothetical protein
MEARSGLSVNVVDSIKKTCYREIAGFLSCLILIL